MVITVQTLWGLLLQAISLGVLFARISHPQQRARSIFMSETAVISRRDGILKLMFRIADIKVTQVPNLKITKFARSSAVFVRSGRLLLFLVGVAVAWMLQWHAAMAYRCSLPPRKVSSIRACKSDWIAGVFGSVRKCHLHDLSESVAAC